MPLAFTPSTFGTLGVEYEVDVIDRTTSSQLPIASHLSTLASAGLVRGRVTPDLFESTIEFATGICESIGQVGGDLCHLLQAIGPHLDTNDAALLGMGLHPFAHASTATIADAPRYREIMENIAWPARRVPTNSLQIHVGMTSGDEAVDTARRLRSVLPIVLALSASSPFRHGIATGLASTRMSLFASVPRSGPMPDFADWHSYARYCEIMIDSESIPSASHIWWDCRIQPSLGTIELRIGESVPDLDDVLALTALMWTMTVASHRLERFQLPREVSDENRWRAIRHGHQARMIIDDCGTTAPLPQVVERLLETLDSTAIDLGCRAELERCSNLSKGEGRHQSMIEDRETDRELDAARASAFELRVTP